MPTVNNRITTFLCINVFRCSIFLYLWQTVLNVLLCVCVNDLLLTWLPWMVTEMLIRLWTLISWFHASLLSFKCNRIQVNQSTFILKTCKKCVQRIHVLNKCWASCFYIRLTYCPLSTILFQQVLKRDEDLEQQRADCLLFKSIIWTNWGKRPKWGWITFISWCFLLTLKKA